MDTSTMMMGMGSHTCGSNSPGMKSHHRNKFSEGTQDYTLKGLGLFLSVIRRMIIPAKLSP